MEDARGTEGGLLVVRLWFDGPPPGGMRARVLSSVSLDAEPQQSAVVHTTAELHNAVSVWLESWPGLGAGSG